MERELNLSEVSDGKRYGLHDLVKVGCEDCAGCSSCCQGMEDTITPMVDVDFLVIDDLGTEPILNNITIEYLFAVLNARSRKEAPYAVATNLTSDQLQSQYGERVFSRLMDRAKLFLFQGKDLRIHAVRNQGN